MKIKKLVIKNYKKYRDISIELNSGINIFVGDNNSGKSTILEAISMVLTGKINGIPITNKLNLDWFNYEVREEFKSSIINKSYIDPPSILIEAYFEPESLSDNDIKLNSYRGSNNSLSEDSVGVKIDIKLNSDYSSTYKELLKNEKIEDIPIELYKIDFRNFTGTPDYYVTTTLKKIAIIDTTKKDYGTILNRFISNSISNFLSEDEKTNLRLAYRANRKDFTNNEAVRNLNDKISSDYSFNNKKINLNLKENDLLIIAPRHPERFAEVEKLASEYAKKHDFSFAKFSQRHKFEAKVNLLDTLGELVNVYAISDIVVLGGSFVPNIGGHNPIECAQFNPVIIIGEFIFNQKALFSLVENIYITKASEIGGIIDSDAKKSKIAVQASADAIIEDIRSTL